MSPNLSMVMRQCSVKPDLPRDCGVVLGGVFHAAVHAACGGRHGVVPGMCSGGDRAASSPSSYHFAGASAVSSWFIHTLLGSATLN